MEPDELSIYFSNYAVEHKEPSTYSNELQMKVLLLLSNHVLIPPTHFLKMNNESILKLNEMKPLFDRGYLCTTLYQGFQQVTDYLRFKIEHDKEYESTYRYRLEKLDELFASEHASVLAKDTSQGGEFSSILLDQLEVSKNTVQEVKLEKGIAEEISVLQGLLANSSRGFLYKTEVKNGLLRPKKGKNPSKSLLNETMAVIDRSYLLAGAVSNNSILSYAPYYHEIGLPLTYGGREVTSLVYSTKFFLMVLRALKIIDDPEELERLSVKDILDLKASNEFHKFVEEYRKLCGIVSGEDIDPSVYENHIILNRKQKNLVWWTRLSKCMLGLAGLPLDLLLGNIESSLGVPVLTIATICIEALCSQGKLEQYGSNVADKFSIRLSKRVDAFSSFCFLLRQKLQTVE